MAQQVGHQQPLSNHPSRSRQTCPRRHTTGVKRAPKPLKRPSADAAAQTPQAMHERKTNPVAVMLATSTLCSLMRHTWGPAPAANQQLPRAVTHKQLVFATNPWLGICHQNFHTVPLWLLLGAGRLLGAATHSGALERVRAGASQSCRPIRPATPFTPYIN